MPPHDESATQRDDDDVVQLRATRSLMDDPRTRPAPKIFGRHLSRHAAHERIIATVGNQIHNQVAIVLWDWMTRPSLLWPYVCEHFEKLQLSQPNRWRKRRREEIKSESSRGIRQRVHIEKECLYRCATL